jgi:hypothetical protein
MLLLSHGFEGRLWAGDRRAQVPLAGDRVSCFRKYEFMVLPPASMDLGLLLISIGVVNLWRATRQGT